MRRQLATLALSLFAGAAVLSGCQGSFSVGGASVSADDVASKLEADITDDQGDHPTDITCPDDLPGRVGASITCTIGDGGQDVPVLVSVTTVKGTDVEFDYKVGSPSTTPSDGVSDSSAS